MVMSVARRVENLRKLAVEMRNHAGETEMPVYVELMLRTARQLEQEADKLERDGPYRHTAPAFYTRVRYTPSEH